MFYAKSMHKRYTNLKLNRGVSLQRYNLYLNAIIVKTWIK